jgi:hypothetical protein
MVITFFVTLILILVMFGIKLYEIKKGSDLAVTEKIKSLDVPVQGFIDHVKHEISYLTWNNLVLLIKYLIRYIQNYILSYKKSLDSRQPRFLIATTPNALAHKNRKGPSSFLKAISEKK